jgi:hypothetical protein
MHQYPYQHLSPLTLHTGRPQLASEAPFVLAVRSLRVPTPTIGSAREASGHRSPVSAFRLALSAPARLRRRGAPTHSLHAARPLGRKWPLFRHIRALKLYLPRTPSVSAAGSDLEAGGFHCNGAPRLTA